MIQSQKKSPTSPLANICHGIDRLGKTGSITLTRSYGALYPPKCMPTASAIEHHIACK